MRKKLKETKFVKYYGDLEKSLLEQIWENKDGNMTDDDYKKEMRNYLYFVSNYNFKFSLIDTRLFNYIITPEIQEWVDKKISIITKNIVKKIIFVVPKDIFSHMSIEQTMEEKNGLEYQEILFFEDINEAKNCF